MNDHSQLDGSGQQSHDTIDQLLPNDRQKDILNKLSLQTPPVTVSGARDDPEAALASLLNALDTLGLIDDTTTAS